MGINKLTGRFEKNIEDLHRVLENAAEYYGDLFTKMVNKGDITASLKNVTYTEQIQVLNERIDLIQTELSKVLGSDEKLKLFQINRRLEANNMQPLSENTKTLAKECIERYEFVMHRVKMIEEYFKQQVDEYKTFFESLYTDTASVYNPAGVREKVSNGASLVSRQA